MGFDSLGTGMTAQMLGLAPRDAFWLGIGLIALSVLTDLLAIRAVRDRKVLGRQPVTGGLVAWMILSTLGLIAGMALLFF